MPKFYKRHQNTNSFITKKLHELKLVHLGTWTIFTWELGLFLLGNLDGFYLGTWTDFTWELGRNLLTIHLYTPSKKKRRNTLCLYRGVQIHLSTGYVTNLFQIV